MNTLIKADISFFITSIAVVIMTGLAIILTLRIIRILRTLEDLTEKGRDEFDSLLFKIHHIEEVLRDKVTHVIKILDLIHRSKERHRARKTPKTTGTSE